MHKTVSLRLLFCGKRKAFHLLVSVFAVCTLFVSGFYREIPQEYSQIVCDESTDRIYGDPEIPEPVRNTQTVRNLNGTEWQLLIDARELKLPKTGRLSRASRRYFSPFRTGMITDTKDSIRFSFFCPDASGVLQNQ